jgi:nucleoside-diphosphate-sugar epimerase
MFSKKILITGACGLIGGIAYNYLRQFSDTYEIHALARSRQPRRKGAQMAENWVSEIPDHRFHLTDLADFNAVQKAVNNIDIVVHLAATASGKADWETALNSNIIGTYNIFEASRQAGVKRVVFASTIQVMWGYRFQEPYDMIFKKMDEDKSQDMPVLTPEMPTRPLSFYGCSKVCGEAIAHMYAYTHGMSSICLRIGSVPVDNRPRGNGGGWCSHRDLAQLIHRCIDASDEVRFDVFYAVSNNKRRWMDIEHAREVVGYIPQDRAEDYP